MSGAVIELKHLTKYYGKQRGIEDISFSVERGEIFGFIGPNGAGKSTTIRTMMGLLKASSGSAEIFGLDCRRNASEVAKNVGYLPSENSYYATLKVHEMLQYTAELYGIDGKARMQELAERLNLDLSRKICDLSLGNKKKVGIVSALLPSPQLLILDEPTTGLDPLVQQTFYSILREENAKGATIFLSSHVLSEVQRLCGRAAILRDGKLIDIQSIRDIREHGYKKITLSCAKPLMEALKQAPGVANVCETPENTSFMYCGAVRELMALLGRLEFHDILIEEPPLEDVFLHYYG